jgi:hypothetical protein
MYTALDNSCQENPSEYAYRNDSVTVSENVHASCRKYPADNLPEGVPPDYIHCDGILLILADSSFGQEPYRSSDYYVWSAGSAVQLLFIFPTRVSLTAIKLHYYSESVRGRPRLEFYAVSDDFDVWDALTSGNQYVGIPSVPPGVDPAGHRSVSVYANFNTMKVLMYKHDSDFPLVVSEVQFFSCSCKLTIFIQ